MAINTPTGGDEGLKTKKGELIDEKKNEVSEVLDIPQELKDYRKAWKERIDYIGDKEEQKIINATEKIPVKIETDSDGNRLIKFKLGKKTYKILDSNLKNHTDNKYKYEDNGKSIIDFPIVNMNKSYVILGGMRGDDVENRENQKLKEYIKQKEGEGFHIAKKEEMEEVLRELGKCAKLDNEDEEIAMLMYLTGMDGLYWLTMSKPTVNGKGSRDVLRCDAVSRRIDSSFNDVGEANLCMISYE